MSVLRVRRVLVALGRVVGGQRGSVDAGVVEGAAALVPAAALHHEVTTHGSAGHVCGDGQWGGDIIRTLYPSSLLEVVID